MKTKIIRAMAKVNHNEFIKNNPKLFKKRQEESELKNIIKNKNLTLAISPIFTFIVGVVVGILIIKIIML